MTLGPHRFQQGTRRPRQSVGQFRCRTARLWIAAATVDGWVLERLAASLAHDSPSDLESNTRLFKLCMAWVVSSTNVGVVLTSIGIFIAAAGLLRNGRSWQIAGTVGLVVGAALSFSILAGRL
jgi:hypothetical protein